MSLIEIRIHGRGGLGAKTAGQLIAETALSEGKYIQAFPEYGPERTGAPVKSYVKISNKPILSYAPIKHAEIVLVIDDSLLCEKIVENIASTCIIIINTNKPRSCVFKELNINKFKGDIYLIDATQIALKEIGKNLPNLVLVGSLIKVSNDKLIKLGNFKRKTKELLGKKGKEIAEKNIRAIQKGYDEIKKK